METSNDSNLEKGVPPAPEVKQEPNPFTSQIEQAKKEWESMNKEPEKEPEPAPTQPPPTPADKQETKTPLELKDEAISKAKAEMRQLQTDMKKISDQYEKALAEKNEIAAALAKSRYEETLQKSDRLAMEEYFITAKANGVKDMDSFRYNAQHYIPGLLANPAIGQILDECKNTYAVQELLFSRMAKGGVTPEQLCAQATPTLRTWIFELAAELEASAKQPAATTAPATTAVQQTPKSVVASAGSDNGQEPTINMESASMEELIRHTRRYGAKGLG